MKTEPNDALMAALIALVNRSTQPLAAASGPSHVAFDLANTLLPSPINKDPKHLMFT